MVWQEIEKARSVLCQCFNVIALELLLVALWEAIRLFNFRWKMSFLLFSPECPFLSTFKRFLS